MKTLADVLNRFDSIQVIETLCHDTFLNPKKVKGKKGYLYERIVIFEFLSDSIEVRTGLFDSYLQWLETTNLNGIVDIPVMRIKTESSGRIRGIVSLSTYSHHVDNELAKKLENIWISLAEHLENDNILGFTWNIEGIDTPVPKTIHYAVSLYRQQFAGLVWDAAKLENNPLTFVEIKTLLDGVTIGGRKVSDVEQVTNLADSSRALIDLVRNDKFHLNKETILKLHTIVARNEALEWGVFRGEGDETHYTPYVRLGEQRQYHPLPTSKNAENLNSVFHRGIDYIKQLPPYEGALVLFLFCALQQFFFDGNKRTGRHMMNGWLMRHGYPPLTIPAEDAQVFNDLMIDFYKDRNGTEMLMFLNRCHNPRGIKNDK